MNRHPSEMMKYMKCNSKIPNLIKRFFFKSGMNFCAAQGEDLFDGLSVGAGELGVPFCCVCRL